MKHTEIRGPEHCSGIETRSMKPEDVLLPCILILQFFTALTLAVHVYKCIRRKVPGMADCWKLKGGGYDTAAFAWKGLGKYHMPYVIPHRHQSLSSLAGV